MNEPVFRSGEVDHAAGTSTYRAELRSRRRHALKESFATGHLLEVDVAATLPLPLPDASHDTVLCTRKLEMDGQGIRFLTELLRIVRPGGTVIVEVKTEARGAEEDPRLAIARTMRDLGATVTDILPGQVLDGHPFFATLPTREISLIEKSLEDAFAESGATEFWGLLERSVFPAFPELWPHAAIIVARRDGGETPTIAWTPSTSAPRELPGRMGSIEVQERLGQPAFDRFIDEVETHLARFGAILLVATLGDRLLNHLPVTIDFLSMVSRTGRERILTQVTWMWAREWHADIPREAASFDGVHLPPLMEYEAMNRLAPVLRTLVQEHA